MLDKLMSRALLVASFCVFSAVATAQCPEPTGCVNFVKVNGAIVEGLHHEFYPDGTWEMWSDDKGTVGWGTWDFDEENCRIDYVNLSGDGGGNQTGTYEWDDEKHEWERTAASHQGAPPLSLVPPL